MAEKAYNWTILLGKLKINDVDDTTSKRIVDL